MTMTDPGSVFLCADTEFSPDVTIEPNVVFGAGGEGRAAAWRSVRSAILKAASSGRTALSGHMPDCGRALDWTQDVHIGNFVEVKAAHPWRRGEGEPPELSRRRGHRARHEHRRRHDHLQLRWLCQASHQDRRAVFIGSDTALVAPVSVGDGAIVAAGSVITEDVAPDALAIARGRQESRTVPAMRRCSDARRRRARRSNELMCGIVGVIGTRPAAPLILDALRRLEYRGYDSAGIATLVNGHIDRRRAEGKLGNLAAALERRRWPEPPASDTRAGRRTARRPRTTRIRMAPSRVSLVHNGIIENHAELRAELEAAGQEFSTETDTETVAQLVDLNLKRGMTPIEAAGAAFGGWRAPMRWR